LLPRLPKSWLDFCSLGQEQRILRSDAKTSDRVLDLGIIVKDVIRIAEWKFFTENLAPAVRGWSLPPNWSGYGNRIDAFAVKLYMKQGLSLDVPTRTRRYIYAAGKCS
jgi:hypothetical protein